MQKEVLDSLTSSWTNAVEKTWLNLYYSFILLAFKTRLTAKATRVMENKHGYAINNLNIVTVFNDGLALLQWETPFPFDDENHEADYVYLRDIA